MAEFVDVPSSPEGIRRAEQPRKGREKKESFKAQMLRLGVRKQFCFIALHFTSFYFIFLSFVLPGGLPDDVDIVDSMHHAAAELDQDARDKEHAWDTARKAANIAKAKMNRNPTNAALIADWERKRDAFLQAGKERKTAEAYSEKGRKIFMSSKAKVLNHQEMLGITSGRRRATPPAVKTPPAKKRPAKTRAAEAESEEESEASGEESEASEEDNEDESDEDTEDKSDELSDGENEGEGEGRGRKRKAKGKRGETSEKRTRSEKMKKKNVQTKASARDDPAALKRQVAKLQTLVSSLQSKAGIAQQESFDVAPGKGKSVFILSSFCLISLHFASL